jgi:hypothetical protein
MDETFQEIWEYLKTGKQIRDQVGKAFQSQFRFNGKTLEEWRQEFYIKLEEDMNPQDVIAVGARASHLYEVVTFHFNEANSSFLAIESEYERRLAEKMNEIFTSHIETPKNLRPGVEAVKTMAEVQLVDLQSALINAQIVKDFWENLRGHLNNLKYNLQTINNSLINQRKIDKEYE